MTFLVGVLTLDLGEVASYMPIKGVTIPYLVQRFMDSSLAFAFGMYGRLLQADDAVANHFTQVGTIGAARKLSVLIKSTNTYLF